MTNRQEVQIQTWGPDAGNPTPKDKGFARVDQCSAAAWPSRVREERSGGSS